MTMVGGCHVFIPMFNPLPLLEAIQREKVAVTLIVPTMINALLNHPEVDHYDVSSLRRIAYGGSPIPLELLKKGLQKWEPIFAQAYGMTEALPKSGAGKILKRDLREKYWVGKSRRVN